MVKNLKLIALFLTLVISIFSVNAQTVLGTAKTEGFQVADPSFENWTQQFDGKPALGGGSTGANTGKGLWYGANVYKDLGTPPCSDPMTGSRQALYSSPLAIILSLSAYIVFGIVCEEGFTGVKLPVLIIRLSLLDDCAV